MSLLNNITIKVRHIFIEYILYVIRYCDIIRISEILLDYMEDVTNKGKGLYVISMVFFLLCAGIRTLSKCPLTAKSCLI